MLVRRHGANTLSGVTKGWKGQYTTTAQGTVRWLWCCFQCNIRLATAGVFWVVEPASEGLYALSHCMHGP